MTQFQEDQFNYTEHIQTNTLLNNQKLVSSHPEEMLFVIIHQVYELWFKQLIHDSGRTIAHLQKDELAQATWLVQRMGRILRVADTQLGVLEMLTFADFQEFRPFLEKSSGLQSRQFRDFEVLGGLAETAGEHYVTWAETLWPGIVASHPNTLHSTFVAAIGRSGTPLIDIYRNRWDQFQLFSLCEACLEMDRLMTTWRHNHIQMVKRMIGGQAQGTGGTFVEKYLEPTTKYKFFPELWDVRHEMTAASGGVVVSDQLPV
ncbi:MAG: tryptophan 2,3-dioxygenase [Cellvibrionaceae bacterium]|jgi:tryptophan 2,3-dioxygenase